jgi:hypothetical protein
MSVVNNDGAAAFGRSVDRARYLGERLGGAWAHLLSAEGREFVRWLAASLEPVLREVFARPEPPPPPDGSRYRKASGLRTWPVEQGECLMTFSPAANTVRWLDLNAWLIFELSDGRTPAELERAYLDVVGARMAPNEARRQLRSGLDNLVSHALIEYPTHHIGEAT